MKDIKTQYRTVMEDHFPEDMTITLGNATLHYQKRAWKLPGEDGVLEEMGLRYGENPGQEAAMYQLVKGNLELGGVQFIEPGRALVSGLNEEDMLQAGKHPGKTNLTDVDNALNILRYIKDRPAAAIMKHNNPSGAAMGQSIAQAYERAFKSDMIAAFGGAAVLNRPVDKETAQMMGELYLEVIAAPDFEEGVMDILRKWKNLRILRISAIDRIYQYHNLRFLDIKSLIDGGIIIQQSPLNKITGPDDFIPASATYQGKTYTTLRMPTVAELEDAVFGWAVEQAVTSNSVLFVKEGCTISVGAGQQDRVGVAKLAVAKAYEKYMNRLAWQYTGKNLDELSQEVKAGKKDAGLIEQIEKETRAIKAGLIGSTMVSDAFFPFRDGVQVGLDEEVALVVHPGGAIRDWDVIQACNEAKPQAAMVFTGQRAFKH